MPPVDAPTTQDPQEQVQEVQDPQVEEPNYDEFDLDFKGEEGDETSVQNLNPTEPTSQVTKPTEPAPTTEPETEPAPEDDIESLRKQLAEANLRILQFEQRSSQPQPQTPTQPQPAPAPTPQQTFPTTPSEVSNLDFIGNEDHIRLLESKEAFNGLLNKVATVAFNAAVMASQERILRQIPGVVETTANQQLRIKDIVGRFYATNKDLEPYKPAVSMAAIKLHNENPNMPLEEMLNKAAEETRKVLRIRPGAPNRQRRPAQPVGSGRVGGDRTSRSQTLSDQEQQILDLLS